MRAITVQQPYAFAIACGAKPVENRGRHIPWTSAVGERIAIHAGKAWHKSAMADRQILDLGRQVVASNNEGLVPGWELLTFLIPQGHVLGALVAVATLSDVHWWQTCSHEQPRQQSVDHASAVTERSSLCSEWAESDGWHLVLSDVFALPQPVPVRGYQGLWTVPAAELVALEEQTARAT